MLEYLVETVENRKDYRRKPVEGNISEVDFSLILSIK